MKFYFSGVAGPDELAMLKLANVKRVMVDVYQVQDWFDWPGSKALDSGAYAVYKGKQPDVGAGLWLVGVEDRIVKYEPVWDMLFALDVIGDPDGTMWNWQFLRQHAELTFAPVYQWDAPEDHLRQYLNEANIVGIGGLVQKMRDKDQYTLDVLVDLCQRHSGRFHVFGLNWPKAITALRGLLYSADSSKWLDGARYHRAIFENTRTGNLSSAPAKVLTKYYPELEDIDRAALCAWNASNIEAHCKRR